MKPKPKVRRASSEQDVTAAKGEIERDIDVGLPISCSGRPLGQVPDLLPEISRSAHDLPSRACRSADDVYNHLKPVQEGRHGVVYRAQCKETGEMVALKNVKSPKDANPGGFSMVVMREVNVLWTLDHPNIVKLKEVVHVSQEDDEESEDANWFLVMEFVEHDLKDIITIMKTPFSVPQVKYLMYQLLDAVLAMHEVWVFHRDLKTANLLLDGKGTLKVCDLGMARHFSDYGKKDYTEEVISRWYRPPELLLGTKEYDEGVDVWSIGCIFGELLQRAVLLPGESEIDQLNKSWELIGTPNKDTWPEFSSLITTKGFKFSKTEKGNMRTKFPKIGYDPDYIHGESCKTTSLSESGYTLFRQMLCPDPKGRASARACLESTYFSEAPHAEPISEELLTEMAKGKSEALAKAKNEAKLDAQRKKQAQVAAGLGINPNVFTNVNAAASTGFSAGAGVSQSQLLQQMLAQQRMTQMQAMGGSLQGNFPGMSNPLMAGQMPGTCQRCRLVLALCACNK